MKAIYILAIALSASSLSSHELDQKPNAVVSNYEESDKLSTATERGAEPTVQVAVPRGAAGVMLGDLSKRSNFPMLYISGVDKKDRFLCISLFSADGFFSSRSTLELTDELRKLSVIRVRLPAEVNRFARLPAIELAALVRASSSRACSESDDVLAASWQPSKTWALDETIVLIGGEGRRATPDIRLLDQDRSNVCAPIGANGRSRAGYRWACRVKTVGCKKTGKVAIDWRRGTDRDRGPRFRFRRLCIR